jgi:hypothetical protein
VEEDGAALYAELYAEDREGLAWARRDEGSLMYADVGTASSGSAQIRIR